MPNDGGGAILRAMIAALHDLFLHSPPLLIFTIMGLGYFLGHVRLAGFHLNVGAVLFVGIAFGAWDSSGFQVPEPLYVIGLILYIYAIGLQSGPSFFALFRERGIKYNVLALIGVAIGTGTALVVQAWLRLPQELTAGLFCGSLTSTPALAAATDSVRGLVTAGLIASGEASARLAAPTHGYSIAYPFGVVGSMLAMQLVSWLFQVSFVREREMYQQRMASHHDLRVVEFRVTNATLAGKTIKDAMIGSMTGVILTRLRHGTATTLVTADTCLQLDDVVMGVGTGAAIDKATLLIGPLVNVGVKQASPQIEHRDFVVTNRALIGRPVWDLNADTGVGLIVSRVKRGYVNLPIDHQTTFELGDQVRVVSYHDSMDRVAELFGDPIKDLSETDFLSISLGVILGILIGMVPIPLPGGVTLRLGFAGGPLIVALLLGRLGRTGPIVWTLPTNANLTIRQLGLHLFMAGIGLKAGAGILTVLNQYGVPLFFGGLAITFVTAVATLVIGYKLLRIDMTDLLGIVSGVHTQPACLALAGRLSGSDAPNLAYSAVQPLSMILKIVVVQLLVIWR